ncbi:MAG TPA: hypothetical protein ENJ41_02270, partial [Oceanospirillales bacterium]|nr:hypothetical protein [Oceanospirillales bacterium]
MNNYYKKWNFECNTSKDLYYIRTFSGLVCHQLINKADFYKITFNQHPNLERYLLLLNKEHWLAINQLICDGKKYQHRQAIIDKRYLMAALKKVNISISNRHDGYHRITLGDFAAQDKQLIDNEVTSFAQWQQTLKDIWLSGHNINWQQLYPESSFKRLSLPAYQFDKKTFWAQQKVLAPTDYIINTEASEPPKNIDIEPTNNKKYSKEAIKQEVKKALSSILLLDIDQVNLKKNFEAYGMDSMGYTQLSECLNDQYHTSLTPACFYGFKTVENLIECIEQEECENLEPKSTNEQEKSITESIEVNTEENNDIAIIGYAGILPKAPTVDDFWHNLVNGVDGISEIPAFRWDWREYYSSNAGEKNKSPSKWGGFMPGIAAFDAAYFGITPQEAKFMDPQQRLLLQTTWQALEHSGHMPAAFAGTDTGVFVGASTSDYEELIRKHELVAHASTGMNRSIIANRISFLLDLQGPSELIDTACSSSMVAIHKAVEAIKQGHCQYAIAAGVNALITPTHFLSYGKAGMLSADGHCKTFDADANGYVRGEGVGVLILKSLDKAIQDGDSIHAVIKASGMNHGGRASSLTAPNPNAQAQLIYDIYRKANINSHSIDYIENHGTGTPLGDPIEINGLNKAFRDLAEHEGQNKELLDHKCLLASVKSNIGHLEAAAGVAGVLKVILALKNQVLPASQNIKKINPLIKLNDKRFEILRHNRPWKSGDLGKLRRAGVSSFGFGGVNAHVVLEEFIQENKGRAAFQQNIFVLSAKNKAALDQYVNNYITYISEHKADISLQNLLYTLQLGRNPEKYRLAVPTENIEQLLSALKDYQSAVNSAAFFTAVAVEDYQETTAADIVAMISTNKLSELAHSWTQGAD